MATKLKGQQSISIDQLDQIVDSTTKNYREVTRAINSELTMPLRMTTNGIYTVSVDSIVVTNPEHGRNRTIPPISGVVPPFTSGAIAVPNTNGGSLSPSPGAGSVTLSISTDLYYVKVGVSVNTAGQLVVTLGSEGSTVSNAGEPDTPPSTYGVGYFVVQRDDSLLPGASIQVLSNSDIYQYTHSGMPETIIRQNKNAQLVAGGTWSWNSGTNTLAWSADAYISIGGIAHNVNRIAAGNSTGLSAGDRVLYVELRRSGGAGTLTVNSAAINAVNLTDDTFIIARRIGNDVMLAETFLLVNGNKLKLGEVGPLTNKGDILTHDGNNLVRLGVGTDNFVLTADSSAAGGLSWASVLVEPLGMANGDMLYKTGGAIDKLDHPGDSSYNVVKMTGTVTTSVGQIDNTGFFDQTGAGGAKATSALWGVIKTYHPELNANRIQNLSWTASDSKNVPVDKDIIVCNTGPYGATLNLPIAANFGGRMITIVKNNDNPGQALARLRIRDTTSSIAGQVSQNMHLSGSCTVYSDGSKWIVIDLREDSDIAGTIYLKNSGGLTLASSDVYVSRRGNKMTMTLDGLIDTSSNTRLYLSFDTTTTTVGWPVGWSVITSGSAYSSPVLTLDAAGASSPSIPYWVPGIVQVPQSGNNPQIRRNNLWSSTYLGNFSASSGSRGVGNVTFTYLTDQLENFN